MQLLDGTVWMLSMSGRVWTPNRLRAAAKCLAEISSEEVCLHRIERRLASEIDVEAVQVRFPTVDCVDVSEWGLEADSPSVDTARHGQRNSLVLDTCAA